MRVSVILITLILLSLSMLVSGIDVKASPATWTVGVGGDFSNVSEALSSGLLADGDTLIFISDVNDYWGLVIDVNLTIDGGGYRWKLINNTPGESTGLYIVDTLGHTTDFTLLNISMVSASINLSQFIFTNASVVNLTNVSFLFTGTSYSYESAVYGSYSSQDVDFWVSDIFDNGSSVDVIYLEFLGSSNGNIYVEDFYSMPDWYIGDGGLYIWVTDSSVVNFYGDNLFFNNTAYGLVLMSASSSIFDVYVENVYIGNVGSEAILIDIEGQEGSLDLFNSWIWYAEEYAVEVYDYTSLGAPVNIENLFVNYSYYPALYIELYPESDAQCFIRNVTSLYSEDFAVYLDIEPVGNVYGNVSDIFINYSYYAGIEAYLSTSQDIDLVISNVVINYSDDYGIDFMAYSSVIDSVAIDLTNILINGSYYEGIYLGVEAYGGYVNLSSINLGYCGLEGTDAIYVSTRGSDTTYLLRNIVVNNSGSDGISVYLRSSNTYVELQNIYINTSWGEGIEFNTPILRFWETGKLITPNVALSGRNNNITLLNVYVGPLADERTSSLFIMDTSNYINRVYVYHSVFINPIYLEGISNALFLETYFNESTAELVDSIVNVTWTLDVKALSTSTGLPIPDVTITLYNASVPLVTGRTGVNGRFTYVLSYNITDVLRTAPYLSVIGRVDSSSAVWNNTGGSTIPSWYLSVELFINYTFLSILGSASNGLASLSFSGQSGELVVYWYFDPVNPVRSRIERYPIQIVNTFESNNIRVFNVLICFRVAGKDVWLPGQLIIDGNTGTVLLTGPVTLFAKI